MPCSSVPGRSGRCPRASPRSSVALYRAAQAWALLDGRALVLPDDVRTVAHAVLDHRLLLDVLYRHEPHRRAGYRFADRFRIGGIRSCCA